MEKLQMTTTRSRRNRRPVQQNRNATIRTRTDRTGKLRTETFRRDDTTLSAAVSTNSKTDTTRLFIDFPRGYGAVQLTGSEARTLYRLLQKHYSETGKTY
ncbi:hypothetical protein EBS02_11040 [bacterium]|nr:hypothetical protein [bacterium]